MGGPLRLSHVNLPPYVVLEVILYRTWLVNLIAFPILDRVEIPILIWPISPFSVGKNVNPHFGWSNPTTWNYPSFALETSFINFPFLMVDSQFRMVHFVKSLVGKLPQFSVGKMLFLMRQDSFFEYLLKGYILFKDLELLDVQRCFYW